MAEFPGLPSIADALAAAASSKSRRLMDGYVYFIGNREHDFVKIGFTTGHPKTRMNALQTGCPFKLEILLIVDGDPEWEREFHRTCVDARLMGEWFKLSGQVEEVMETMRWFYQNVDGTDGSVRYIA